MIVGVTGTITAEPINTFKINGVNLNVANALEAMSSRSATLRVVGL